MAWDRPHNDAEVRTRFHRGSYDGRDDPKNGFATLLQRVANYNDNATAMWQFRWDLQRGILQNATKLQHVCCNIVESCKSAARP